jgi:hypothetical protein
MSGTIMTACMTLRASAEMALPTPTPATAVPSNAAICHFTEPSRPPSNNRTHP